MFHLLFVCSIQLFSAGPAGAQLIWQGDPEKPWREVFDNYNRQPEGSLTVATDPVLGKVWRVHKPAGSKHAEIRGAKGYKQKEGKTYCIGWNWKIEIKDRTSDGFAVFQWKSCGDGASQNYPFIMDYNGKTVKLVAYGSD